MGLQGVNKWRFFVVFLIVFIVTEISLYHFFPNGNLYPGILAASFLILFIIAVKDTTKLVDQSNKIVSINEEKHRILNKHQLNVIALDQTENMIYNLSKAEENRATYANDDDASLIRIRLKLRELRTQREIIENCQTVVKQKLSNLDAESENLGNEFDYAKTFVVFELISMVIVLYQFIKL